jgi:hypothetical protein
VLNWMDSLLDHRRIRQRQRGELFRLIIGTATVLLEALLRVGHLMVEFR